MAAYAIFETAVGACGIAWSDRGVVGFQLPEGDTASTRRRMQSRFSAAEESAPPQDIDVLIDGVRGSLVPARDDALLRGQQLDELVETAVEKAPAALHMADQALRLVLSAHADAPHTGVDAIRKREIDDPEFAAERHRRFGAPVGELLQSAAAPAGEDKRKRALGRRARHGGFADRRAVDGEHIWLDNIGHGGLRTTRLSCGQQSRDVHAPATR